MWSKSNGEENLPEQYTTSQRVRVRKVLINHLLNAFQVAGFVSGLKF